jgi:hypothetical protein
MTHEEVKWVGWNKSFIITVLAVISALILAGVIIVKQVTRSGCFLFNDGTTQKWTLDQLYDTNSNPIKKITTFVPGSPPKYITYEPFTLTNHNNSSLEANASFYLVSDKKIKNADIFIESPDLSNDSGWQNIEGYRFELTREFFSPCYNLENFYFAQLQIRIIDVSDNSEHLLAETDNTGNFKFHKLTKSSKYTLEWNWGKQIKLGGKLLSSSEYKVKAIRIRITLPGYIGDGECAFKGSWKIDNVCRVRQNQP